jgi:hypothetical protein
MDTLGREGPVVVVFERGVPVFDGDRVAHDEKFHGNLQRCPKCSI